MPWARWRGWACLGFVLVIAYGRYVVQYDQPPALFWDENYWVPSAQKYLDGVYFMDQHPPLGKLLIALGERLVHGNPRHDQYVGTGYARQLPPGFSFAGYRLIPVVLAWLTAGLVFLIFLRLTRRLLLSVSLSFLYIFDNALIVHLRGAMLDSTLLFFSAVTVFLFLLVLDQTEPPGRFRFMAFAFGLSFGLALATKVLALILVFLMPAVLLRLWPRWRQMLSFTSVVTTGCLVAYLGVWQVHFALASRIEPALENHGYYQASEAYRRILSEGRNASLGALPVMLRDSWRYASAHNRGVPRLDLCKPGENGSPSYLWPLGARAINYRWETPDGITYRYLYLQANPVVWACGLAGVLLAAWLVAGPLLSRDRRTLTERFLLAVFLGLYLAYMLAASRIERVLYLYHYFIPLLLSFFLFGLALVELRHLLWFQLTERRRDALALSIGWLVVLSHYFYAPLTDYRPLTAAEFQRRAFLPIWDLRCVGCGPPVSFWCRGRPGPRERTADEAEDSRRGPRGGTSLLVSDRGGGGQHLA